MAVHPGLSSRIAHALGLAPDPVQELRIKPADIQAAPVTAW